MNLYRRDERTPWLRAASYAAKKIRNQNAVDAHAFEVCIIAGRVYRMSHELAHMVRALRSSRVGRLPRPLAVPSGVRDYWRAGYCIYRNIACCLQRETV